MAERVVEERSGAAAGTGRGCGLGCGRGVRARDRGLRHAVAGLGGRLAGRRRSGLGGVVPGFVAGRLIVGRDLVARRRLIAGRRGIGVVVAGRWCDDIVAAVTGRDRVAGRRRDGRAVLAGRHDCRAGLVGVLGKRVVLHRGRAGGGACRGGGHGDGRARAHGDRRGRAGLAAVAGGGLRHRLRGPDGAGPLDGGLDLGNAQRLLGLCHHARLELLRALGRAARPIAQALELARLGEVEQ